ncbi:MAG: glycoside hydrolase family 19 protein, partial [Alphaproteobacteria bacterium]
EYGKAINKDLLPGDAPTLVANDPSMAVDVACWFWKSRRLNRYADNDDVLTVTKRINGGTNGLDDRERLLARAKTILRI